MRFTHYQTKGSNIKTHKKKGEGFIARLTVGRSRYVK